MRRAVELARRGGKETGTNPNVGAVVVHGDRIIGEGYHEEYGCAHAEVNAVAAVQKEDEALLPHSRMYVTLEPCNHHGKTPPCTSLIIEKKIPEVYIGCLDPSSQMSGKSVNLLKQAGCKVTVGILADTCEALLRPFVVHKTGRPYIVLKQAVSQDGYTGKPDEQIWLTGKMSQVVAHEWRSKVDGILIGTNTAVIDNPSLTTRLVEGESPLRIIIDRHGRIPHDHKVLSDGGDTLVITSLRSYHDRAPYVTITDWTLENIVQIIWRAGVRHLLVEGGATIVKAFYTADLWDEALHFTSPKVLHDGTPSVDIQGRLLAKYQLGRDTLQHVAKS
jgi:diaminohydroxyphosphoribosylaminopyrimidine deaminase/5-amino-6-(5-phosphoribosylamino)uracil reductase